jgi:hypothetical protein
MVTSLVPIMKTDDLSEGTTQPQPLRHRESQQMLTLPIRMRGPDNGRFTMAWFSGTRKQNRDLSTEKADPCHCSGRCAPFNPIQFTQIPSRGRTDARADRPTTDSPSPTMDKGCGWDVSPDEKRWQTRYICLQRGERRPKLEVGPWDLHLPCWIRGNPWDIKRQQ